MGAVEKVRLDQVTIQSDQKSAEVRPAAQAKILELRKKLLREKPEFSGGTAHVRRFAITVQTTACDNERVTLTGFGGCSPALSVFIPKDDGRAALTDPLERAIAILSHAAAIGEMVVTDPCDIARSLATAASYALREIEGAVQITRPMPEAPAEICLTSMRTASGFTTFPGRRNPENGEPHLSRLRGLLRLAEDRLVPAYRCQWQRNDGGGYAFIARPSTVSSIWRGLNPIDMLRMHATWDKELSTSGLV